MREIKFRAWDKKNRLWLNNAHHKIWGVELKGDTLRLEPPEYIEIMQYTGLKDKNGKEIYEGDVLKAEGLVDSVMWGARGWTTHPIKRNGHSLWAFASPDRCEVIGNIYESKH